ncbi:AMP-binding protein, partial [Acrocarpospora catenulata]|uniref:AMP-binding protein n=1 Tax=Acrocarpospora catenulata TaxID=2836182 RepID=UPI001BDADFFE
MFPAPVLDALRIEPGRTALEFGERAVTRGELRATVARMVTGLRAAGLGPGSGVVLTTAISPEAYAAELAAHTLGCRVTLLRPGWTPSQITTALNHPIDAFITTPDAPGVTLHAAPGATSGTTSGTVPSTTSGTVPGTTSGTAPGATAQTLDLTTLAAHPAAPLVPAAHPDDTARLTLHTDATGRPAARPLSYRRYGLAFQPEDWPPTLATAMTAFQRYLISGHLAAPLTTTYLGRCLIAGGTAILTPAPLTPTLIDHHHATVTLLSPHRLQALLTAHHHTPNTLTTLQTVILTTPPPTDLTTPFTLLHHTP